jgi:membrane fusion protein
MSTVVARVESRAVEPRPAPANPTLFRPEIMEEMRSQWLGSVLLEPRISHWVFAAGAGLAAVAVIGLLLFGTYTRKERVSGWLVPERGVVRLAAPKQGVIIAIKVHEGATVKAGEPLLVLSAELQSEAAGPVKEGVVRRLEARRDSLVSEKAVQGQLFEQQSADLSARIAALGSERGHLAEEIDLQQEQVDLSEKRLARLRPLRERGLATEPQLEAAEQDRIDQAAKLQTLERAQANLQRELAELEGTLRQLPFTRAVRLAELDRDSAAIEQQLAEAEGQREIVITAPQSGTVTNLRATVGSNVQTDVPLLNIVPSGSTLHAKLFGTSRSVGFVKPGQRVLLRYQAFPYQKFGFYDGTVASVSRTAMSPTDLPQQLSGLTSLYGANEPIYEITVDLAKQIATAYGEPVPLQSGMQLNADIMIDRRRLIEWALDPLFSLTGGWQ